MKLEIEHLLKILGNHRALDSLCLTIENTRALVLLGPSGGGKSTLLRVLAGLEKPDSGSVRINNIPLPDSELGLLLYRRTIGVVFQGFNLFPHLTAFRNITLPLEVVHGLPPAEASEIAKQLLVRFQLEKHAHQKPSQLSGGQRQRIAIARAIAPRPSLVLLDEPTSALDPEMTAEVLQMIEELRDDGRDIILVTHELGFARQVADTIALVSQGTIAEIGPPKQIFDGPKSPITQSYLAKTLRY